MPRHKKRPKIATSYLHSSFFGIEDSLVSTTGLIAGVSVATTDASFILLAGCVAVAVEAISMATGEFLSEETDQDFTKKKLHSSPIIGGVIMFISYSLAGMVPIIPFAIFPPEYALIASMTAALIGLFVLGLVKGKLTHKNLFRSGLQVLVVGGISAIIGVAVGVVFKGI